MHHLSDLAKTLLEQMQPDRVYEPSDLRALLADSSGERLRETMHELWINRQVERVGYSGWRRHQSAPPHRPRPARRDVQIVKPEDLFDHDAFADFFKP